MNVLWPLILALVVLVGCALLVAVTVVVELGHVMQALLG